MSRAIGIERGKFVVFYDTPKTTTLIGQTNVSEKFFCFNSKRAVLP